MGLSNKSTLVLITDTDLNFKFGATNARLLCYAKAISLEDINVIFTSVYYSFLKTEEPELLEGNIYVLGNKGYPKTYSKKSLPVFKELNFVSTFKYLRQLHLIFRDYENVIYLLYPSNFALTFTTATYFRALKRNVVFIEKNELHLGIALNLSAPSGIKFIFYLPAFVLQVLISTLADITEIFFNGMICISTRMEKLYGIFYTKLIIIPILIDIKDKIQLKHGNSRSGLFRIGYFGTISEKKDGIFTFLKSLSYLRNCNQNIECNLYGTSTESINRRLALLISRYQLKDTVKYHGNYDSKDIKTELANQDLLILPRPLNLQTKYGFPTKLAEYMFSGIPVLSTKVSDVALYLVNGENGFLIDSNNIELIVDKLKEIINYRIKLNTIGNQGKMTAIKYFNYTNYSEKLVDFLFMTK